MALRLFCVRSLAAAICGFVVATAGAAGLDDAFLGARDAARAGDGKRLEQLVPRFQGHLLEPYVQYWALQAGLETRDPDAIRAWLAASRDADSPTAA